jgi:hypothetical protein
VTIFHTMSPAELLRARIQQSGLSTGQYAKTVLVRDERTVRRWLAGDQDIPAAVLEFLKEPPG